VTTPPDTASTQPVASAAPAGETQPLGGEGQAPAATAEGPPRVAQDVELLGRFEGSGSKEPPFMARRPDGQMVQLAPLLYLVAERCDGQRSYDQIAREVTETVGRGLEAEDVKMLAEQKLRPLGVLAAPDGSTPQVQKADPFLALKLKSALVPPGVVRAITALFRPLFWPPMVVAVLAGLAVFDVWFFFEHGVAQSMRQLLYQPLFMLMTFALVVLTAAFHETGHATACRYGGAEPGVMGVGIYIVWPAFYTDVTDSYRLGKSGRLRTDLGGVYFNAIVILALAGIYFATGFEPLLIAILVAHLDIFRQLLPLLRLDGYHVLADLTGVPDLFTRIKPILVSLIPGKRGGKRVKELKPWVRVTVTLWVVVFVAFLSINIVYIVLYAPRIFATGWDSFATQFDETSTAFGGGDGAAGAVGVLQMIVLALPAMGIVFGFGRTGGRLTRKVWEGTEGKPAARAGSTLLLIVAVAGLAYLWWPDPENYRPIRPGERWTLTDAATVTASAAGGEPNLSKAEGVRLGEISTTGAVGGDVVHEPESDVESGDEAPSGVEVSPSPTVDTSLETTPEPTTEPSLEATTEPSPEPTTVASP
jgi:putative peptide zinc metalloprotease protein